MRSTKLPIIAAAAAMLALAPSGAAAARGHLRPTVHKHTSAVGHCHVRIALEQSQLTAGDTTVVSGQLACYPSTPAPSPATVTIYGRTATSGGFQILGTANLLGSAYPYSYSFPTAAINSDTEIYASAIGANSKSKLVRVGPIVTFTGPKTPTLEAGRHGDAAFQVGVPGDAGARVFLERENSLTHEEWRVIQTGVLAGAAGEYKFIHKFVAPGEAEIRAVVRPHGQFSAPGFSEALTYDISEKENPLLELTSLPNPAFAGQPITLSGVAKTSSGVAAGQKVTLLGRARGAASYTMLEGATTDSEGKYSFTQAPSQSTFYRVTNASATTSAGKSSALLFEGVKYVLAPAAPPTSAVTGQELMFTGTVTPTVPAGKVFLERENVRGGGFHRVAEGPVTGSAYTIHHVISGSGTEKYRIKVPGSPANQPTSSPAFSIVVTRAAG